MTSPERRLLQEARGAVFHVAEESLNDSNRKLARGLLERIDVLLSQPESKEDCDCLSISYCMGEAMATLDNVRCRRSKHKSKSNNESNAAGQADMGSTHGTRDGSNPEISLPAPAAPSEVPTPRTDRVVLGVALYDDQQYALRDMTEHARQLERDLSAALERERLANMRADQAQELANRETLSAAYWKAKAESLPSASGAPKWSDDDCLEWGLRILQSEGLGDWTIEWSPEDGNAEGVTLIDSKTIIAHWPHKKPSFSLMLHEVAHAVAYVRAGSSIHDSHFAHTFHELVFKWCAPLPVAALASTAKREEPMDDRKVHKCQMRFPPAWPFERDRCSWPYCHCLREGQQEQGFRAEDFKPSPPDTDQR